jgi:hypothetical protein
MLALVRIVVIVNRLVVVLAENFDQIVDAFEEIDIRCHLVI